MTGAVGVVARQLLIQPAGRLARGVVHPVVIGIRAARQRNLAAPESVLLIEENHVLGVEDLAGLAVVTAGGIQTQRGVEILGLDVPVTVERLVVALAALVIVAEEQHAVADEFHSGDVAQILAVRAGVALLLLIDKGRGVARGRGVVLLHGHTLGVAGKIHAGYRLLCGSGGLGSGLFRLLGGVWFLRRGRFLSRLLRIGGIRLRLLSRGLDLRLLRSLVHSIRAQAARKQRADHDHDQEQGNALFPCLCHCEVPLYAKCSVGFLSSQPVASPFQCKAVTQPPSAASMVPEFTIAI